MDKPAFGFVQTATLVRPANWPDKIHSEPICYGYNLYGMSADEMLMPIWVGLAAIMFQALHIPHLLRQ
jgi:hypothetical protein